MPLSLATALPYVTALVVVILDQVTKVAVRQTLAVGDGFAVVPGFFNIVHVTNRGAAFGLFNRADSSWQTWLLAATSVIAVGLIVFLLRGQENAPGQPGSVQRRLALGLILGGAIGNFADRIYLGHVTDFLDVYYKALHWPAFNLADAAITVGAGLLIWSMLTTRSHVPDPS